MNLVRSLARQITELFAKFTARGQIKTITGTSSANLPDAPGLRFNNLVIGKTYTVRAQVLANAPTTTANAELEITHDGNFIMILGHTATGGVAPGRSRFGDSVTFVATATTIITNIVAQNGGTIAGNGTTQQTWMQLIEEPYDLDESAGHFD